MPQSPEGPLCSMCESLSRSSFPHITEQGKTQFQCLPPAFPMAVTSPFPPGDVGHFKWHSPPRTAELAQSQLQEYNHSAAKPQCFNTCLSFSASLLNQDNLGGVAAATTTAAGSPPVYAKPKLAIVMPLFTLSRASSPAPNPSRTIYSHLHTSPLPFTA